MTAEKKIQEVDRKLDAAIYERKADVNAVRSELNLTQKELSMEIREIKKDIAKVSKDVCSVKGDIKTLSNKLDEKFNKVIDEIDGKYAQKDDLNNLKRMTYAIIGALITFLVWTLQEYLRMGN